VRKGMRNVPQLLGNHTPLRDLYSHPFRRRARAIDVPSGFRVRRFSVRFQTCTATIALVAKHLSYGRWAPCPECSGAGAVSRLSRFRSARRLRPARPAHSGMISMLMMSVQWWSGRFESRYGAPHGRSNLATTNLLLGLRPAKESSLLAGRQGQLICLFPEGVSI
jgi:hypothetical protein